MSWIDRIQGVFGTKETDVPQFEPQASAVMFSVSYDGEKNEGEIGPIKDYSVDNHSLTARAWQSYLDSEVTHNMVNRYTLWAIGSGLRIDVGPMKDVLTSEGITAPDDFNKLTQVRFNTYADALMSSHSGQGSLNQLANEAFRSAIIGGDVLVIRRFENEKVTTQIIDGAHVMTPTLSPEIEAAEKRGNKIYHGVEINSKGKHIAYHVHEGDHKFKRVKAESNGITMANLVYGAKYRIDDIRGIPLISAILETLSKLERYKEATVASAEERAKIPYYIKHGTASDGSSPLQQKLSKNMGVSQVNPDNTTEEVQQQFSESYNKMLINLPRDSDLGSLASNVDLEFGDFYKVNLRLVCATFGIPMEVALSWYENSYSASRAALKDWEHVLKVTRKSFSDQFYKPTYSFWLKTEILKKKIEAPGYITGMDNPMIMAAYTGARFRGANIPHIDPLKEVQAERLKLGNEAIPLTTAQAATENLNSGEFESNVEQYERELKQAKDLNNANTPAE